MINILIIQPSVPYYRITFFEELALKLNEKITILHFSKKTSIDHPLIKEILGEYNSFYSIKTVKGIKGIIKDFNMIITVFDPHWINLFTLPFSCKDKKIIFWGHGLGKNKIINTVRVFLTRNCQSIITYSNDRKQRLVASGVPKEMIFVANNTIHISNSQDSSKNIKKTFLYVGRLQRRKKIDVFFRIFKSHELGSQGYKIVLIGDGDEEKKYLKDYGEKVGINEYLEFINGTSDENILRKYFLEAIYYVSPGAVGLGVLHSFAYGVPVLTMEDKAHGPEFDNIVNHENGMVFKNEDDFKNQLLSFLEKCKYQKMGYNAYHLYKSQRNINIMVNGFIDAINYILVKG